MLGKYINRGEKRAKVQEIKKCPDKDFWPSEQEANGLSHKQIFS
jgi:hypothetical protein